MIDLFLRLNEDTKTENYAFQTPIGDQYWRYDDGHYTHHFIVNL